MFLFCCPGKFNSKFVFDVLKQFNPKKVGALKDQKISLVVSEWCRRTAKPYQEFEELKAAQAQKDIETVVYFMPGTPSHSEILKWCASLHIPLIEVYEKNGAYHLNVR